MSESGKLPMATRRARVERVTSETSISLELVLDGQGEARVDTGIGFLDHMLTSFARHSLCDLVVDCRGDLDVDGHHTVEDIGICLGQALAQAVGNKAGIRRYGQGLIPMDEALVECALDFSGRPYLAWEGFRFTQECVGTFDTSLTVEFFRSVAVNGGLTLHMICRSGENAHHIIEAAFKALARAIAEAVSRVPGVSSIPSTKGIL